MHNRQLAEDLFIYWTGFLCVTEFFVYMLETCIMVGGKDSHHIEAVGEEASMS